MKPNKLFVVGEFFPHLDNWMFIGVFDSEFKARKACYNVYCFIGPAILNENLGSEITDWSEAYYPHVTNNQS